MKKWLIFFVLLSAIVVVANGGNVIDSYRFAAATGALATDNFNRTNVSPIGGNWTTITSEDDMRIVSNAAEPNSTSNDAGAFYNAISWPNNQYSQANITVNGTETGAGIGVMVRGSSVNRTYYRVTVNSSASSNITLAKMVSGSYTSLWSRTITYSAGALLKIEVSGTTIRVTYNGSAVGADTTDSSIASGNSGLSFSSTVSTASLDNWEGGAP